MGTRWLPRITNPAAAGGGPPPPAVADKFAPRIIVGNVPNGDPVLDQVPPFEYIHDPGDGSGIAAALAIASLGFDIYIRPGTYDFASGAVATPLTIPAGVTVHGAPGGPNGLGGTILRTRTGAGGLGDSQDLFTLGVGASLQDVRIQVPAGVQGGTLGTAIVQVPNISVYLARVYIDMTFGGNGQRNTEFGVASGAGVASGVEDVFEDVEVLLPPVMSTLGVSPTLYTGFGMGAIGVDSVVATGRGPIYRNCVVRGGSTGFVFFNVATPTLDCCTIDNIIANGDCIFYFLDTSATSPVNGPRIVAPRCFISTVADAANSAVTGITITNSMQTDVVLQGTDIVAPQIVFASGVGLVGARQGIKIRVEDGANGENNRGSITGGTIIGAQIDILIQTRTNDNTNGSPGSINDWCISGVQGRDFATFGAFTGEGCQIDIVNVPTRAKINRISVTGCDFSGAPAGTNGVLISAAGVVNTAVTGNQLTPNGGTAWTDNGTGSQITGNVP